MCQHSMNLRAKLARYDCNWEEPIRGDCQHGPQPFAYVAGLTRVEPPIDRSMGRGDGLPTDWPRVDCASPVSGATLSLSKDAHGADAGTYRRAAAGASGARRSGGGDAARGGAAETCLLGPGAGGVRLNALEDVDWDSVGPPGAPGMTGVRAPFGGPRTQPPAEGRAEAEADLVTAGRTDPAAS